MQNLRRRASIPFSVSLSDARAGADETTTPLILKGYTRDMRATGVSLILPAAQFNEQALLREGRTLRLILELPDGPVSIQGVPVRCERLEETADAGGEYLVGVRITEISDEDCLRFVKYLRTLH